MSTRRFCVNGCGRETGKYAGTGRKNPMWCPECDEKRIKHVSEQMAKIAKQLGLPDAQ
jgi:hypothetical protein